MLTLGRAPIISRAVAVRRGVTASERADPALNSSLVIFMMPHMDFEIVSEITNIEVISAGSGVRDRARLRKYYGKGRWRKLKGIARVRLKSATIRLAEIHWYEAHGIGKRDFKLKLPFLD